MKDFNDANGLIEKLSAQLTEERLSELRSLSGIGYLPAGSLTTLIENKSFSIEDIVTVLLSGWVIQSKELETKNARIDELEDLCKLQQQSIDSIADQTTRLKFMLSSILGEEKPMTPVDLLKDIAAKAGSDTSEPK